MEITCMRIFCLLDTLKWGFKYICIFNFIHLKHYEALERMKREKGVKSMMVEGD